MNLEHRGFCESKPRKEKRTPLRRKHLPTAFQPESSFHLSLWLVVSIRNHFLTRAVKNVNWGVSSCCAAKAQHIANALFGARFHCFQSLKNFAEQVARASLHNVANLRLQL